MVPARVLDPDKEIELPIAEVVRTSRGLQLRETTRPMAPSWVPSWLTLLTCILLHGGWLHLIGNMWILFIFGDNVEDRLGHGRYLLFYVGCGLVASLAHFAAGPASIVPTIGASGSIAGVMGAYFIMYPRAKVLTLVPLFVVFYTVVLPAPIFLGVWFAIQLYQGTFSITSTGGGVAWWAHIGGFVAGLAVALACKKRDKLRPAVKIVRPGADRPRIYRTPRRR